MKLLGKALIAAPLVLAIVAGAWFLGRMLAADNGTIPSVKSVSSEVVITKIIDGDTVLVSGGDHVRLLGIDSDEKGYPCYDAARLRLEELILGKTVRLEADREDADQYGRKLRYIFLGNDDINERMVAEGLAVARFYPENQKYKTEIVAAETAAMADKTGCKWNGQAQTNTAALQSAPAGEPQNLVWKNLTGVAVGPCAAKDHVGEEIIIEGEVADAYRSASDTVFVNFGGKYPNNCFAAVIFKDDLGNFSGAPEITYAAKTVRVKGKVQEYQGKPEIILDGPAQIEIGL